MGTELISDARQLSLLALHGRPPSDRDTPVLVSAPTLPPSLSPTPGSLTDTQLKAFTFLIAVLLSSLHILFLGNSLKKKLLSGPTPHKL